MKSVLKSSKNGEVLKGDGWVNYKSESFEADDLGNKIAKQYVKKGKGKQEAQKIGDATPYGLFGLSFITGILLNMARKD